MKSGRLYSLVTKHWPRIAAGLVILIGLIEFAVEGLTADSGLEFYLMAWAGTTGGLWFLFEKAEVALSSEARDTLVGLARRDLRATLEAVPGQFELLFDRVFGDRHFTWSCFSRAAAASIVAAAVSAALVIPNGDSLDFQIEIPLGWSLTIVVAVAIGNLLPDYLSLLETRLIIRWASRTRGLVVPVAVDLILTSIIGFFWWRPLTAWGFDIALTESLALVNAVGAAFLVGWLSTYFTSVWLWVYTASVLLSRVFLKMSDGVGFLLRVTDVENQPFRSMGFVSVLIVSGLFLLGLPLVLL